MRVGQCGVAEVCGILRFSKVYINVNKVLSCLEDKKEIDRDEPVQSGILFVGDCSQING